MNDNPHLMAIIESKLAQARLALRHGSAAKADDLLEQAKIYAEALQTKPAPVRH
jgi:hypothetical protein